MPYVANPRRGPVGVPCNVHRGGYSENKENVKGHLLNPFFCGDYFLWGIPKKAHTNITHMFNKVNNQISEVYLCVVEIISFSGKSVQIVQFLLRPTR